MMHILACGNNAFGQIDAELFHSKHMNIISTPHELLDVASAVSPEDTSAEICKPSWCNLFFKISSGSTDGSLFCRGLQDCECGKTAIICHNVSSVGCSWKHTYVASTQHKVHVFTGSVWKDSKEVQSIEESLQTICNEQEIFSQFSQISSGELHTLALADSGQVFSITMESDFNFICKSLDLTFKAKAVSCGKEHVLLLSRIGTVFSFGIGSRGQLGNGTTNKQDVPRVIEALEGLSVIRVEAGGWHSCAISDIGDLYVWGWNETGQLGLPSRTVRNNWGAKGESQGELEPPPDFINIQTVPSLLDLTCGKDNEITAVSCGSRHTAAITGDGCLYTWGWNAYGQLGQGDELPRDTPSLVHLPGHLVTSVVCGCWNTVIRSVSKSPSNDSPKYTESVQ